MNLKGEPICESLPLGARPSAGMRMNPEKKNGLKPGLCCRLGITLLCLGAAGKIMLCTSSFKIFISDVLNCSSQQNYESHSESSSFLPTLGPQPVYF